VLREKIGKLVTVRSFLKPTGVSPLDVLRQVLDRPDYDRMRAVLVRQLAEAFDGHNVNPCASVVDLGSSRESMRSVRIKVECDSELFGNFDIRDAVVPSGHGDAQVVSWKREPPKRLPRDGGRFSQEITLNLHQPDRGDYAVELHARAILGVGTEGCFAAHIPLTRQPSQPTKVIKQGRDSIYSPIRLPSPVASRPTYSFALKNIRATSFGMWKLSLGGCVHALLVAADRLTLGRSDRVLLDKGEVVVPISEIVEIDAGDVSISRRAVELTLTESDVAAPQVVVRVAQRTDDEAFETLAHSRPEALPTVNGRPERHDSRHALKQSHTIQIAVGHNGGPDGDRKTRGRASLRVELHKQFGSREFAVLVNADTEVPVSRPTLVWLPTSPISGWRFDPPSGGERAIALASVFFGRQNLQQGLLVRQGNRSWSAPVGETSSFQFGDRIYKLTPMEPETCG
jgi:hypothetical protein